MKFHVNAPEDSFFSRGAHGHADDAVHLEIFDEQHPEAARAQTFYSDRKVTVELDEANAPGEMKAATKVEDFHRGQCATGWKTSSPACRARFSAIASRRTRIPSA